MLSFTASQTKPPPKVKWKTLEMKRDVPLSTKAKHDYRKLIIAIWNVHQNKTPKITGTRHQHKQQQQQTTNNKQQQQQHKQQTTTTNNKQQTTNTNHTNNNNNTNNKQQHKQQTATTTTQTTWFGAVHQLSDQIWVELRVRAIDLWLDLTWSGVKTYGDGCTIENTITWEWSTKPSINWFVMLVDRCVHSLYSKSRVSNPKQKGESKKDKPTSPSTKAGDKSAKNVSSSASTTSLPGAAALQSTSPFVNVDPAVARKFSIRVHVSHFCSVMIEVWGRYWWWYCWLSLIRSSKDVHWKVVRQVILEVTPFAWWPSINRRKRLLSWKPP